MHVIVTSISLAKLNIRNNLCEATSQIRYFIEKAVPTLKMGNTSKKISQSITLAGGGPEMFQILSQDIDISSSDFQGPE